MGTFTQVLDALPKGFVTDSLLTALQSEGLQSACMWPAFCTTDR
jgi:hypothetical protein